MGSPYRLLLDAGAAQLPLEVVLGDSPGRLKGLSAAKAATLKQAVGVDSIRELATHPAIRQAQALTAAQDLHHDPGPDADWQDCFAQAPLGVYQQHPSGRFRLEFGPVLYRGRLDDTTRVLIVGQDPATDELLAHRTLVGLSGQRVQGLLRKLGICRSYLCVNTFLYSITGQFDAAMRGITQEAPILGYRNTLFDRIADQNPLELVITFGAAARDAVERWPGKGALPVVDLLHPSAPEADVLVSWNGGLPALRQAVSADEGGVVDPQPYGSAFSALDIADIPRCDLPFGVPDWMGRSGAGHSQRPAGQPKQILWTAP